MHKYLIKLFLFMSGFHLFYCINLLMAVSRCTLHYLELYHFPKQFKPRKEIAAKPSIKHEKKEEEMFYLTTHSTHFIYGRERERNVLFNDALNTFYLRLYGVRHMVKDHSDSEKGNPLPPHRLLLSISSKGSFICTIPQTG